MIITKSKERWQIKKLQHDTLLSPEFDDREFTIFRTFLNKYRKDLEIVFITKKKFHKLSKRKQNYLQWKYEDDGNKMQFLKYLWNHIREAKSYRCCKCNTKTKYLYMFCTNIKYIKDFRVPDWDLYCKECWDK